MKNTIIVQNAKISIDAKQKEEYICLTDIARYKDPKRSDYILQNWMRSKATIEFLCLWERINNTNFNSIEFDGVRNEAGTNSFVLTPKKWITSTQAMGTKSKAGRMEVAYAHKDIAFEFASWISAEFKLFLIKEFQRLKEDEIEKQQLGWDIMRDYATVEQLVVLANLESLKAEFIKQEITPSERLKRLNEIAIEQLELLLKYSKTKVLK